MSIVIITGGSRGLGASAAIQCAKHGMGVILTYNSNPEAVTAPTRAGRRCSMSRTCSIATTSAESRMAVI